MISCTKTVVIQNNKVLVNNVLFFETSPSLDYLQFFKELYKFLGLNYLKFFKMDPLSKLGFLAAELLLSEWTTISKEEFNIILACSHSSMESDIQFQATISNPDNYFPSPSAFVYTLPNIVIGEIAIKHQIYGENCMFIIPPDQRGTHKEFLERYMKQTLQKQSIVGYLDFYNNSYYAEFHITNK